MSAAPPLKKNPHHGQAAAVTSRNSRKPLLLIAPSTDIVSPATPAPNFSNVLASSVGFADLRAMCLASCVGTGATSWRPPKLDASGVFKKHVAADSRCARHHSGPTGFS